MKRRPSKKAVLITSLVLLALLLAAGGGYYYYTHTKGTKSDQQSTADSDKKINDALALSSEIAQIAQSEGGAAAQKKIDEKISQADTKQKQAELYDLKIATLYSSNDPAAATKALEYAYKIEEIDPTYKSALTIAEMERDANNKTVALKYYELYIARSTSSDGSSLDPTNKAFYEQRIQELKS